MDIQRDDWRHATKYLLSHAEPGDALLFHVPMGRMPYEFYVSVLGAPSSAPLVLYPHHGDRITFLDFVEKPNDAELAALNSAASREHGLFSPTPKPSQDSLMRERLNCRRYSGMFTQRSSNTISRNRYKTLQHEVIGCHRYRLNALTY